MGPHLAQLGRFVAELAYDRIPPDVRRAARFQLADMIAAAHAAARGDEIDPVLRAIPELAAPGRATVLVGGARLGPSDAALANAACSMAQDFDDIVWMGHTCHSAVFASLAVAEHEGRTTRDLVSAIVSANEVAGRLGASSILGPLNGQMWTFIHLVGAAAATAKLLDLDAEQTTHALAIALAQPNFALQPGFLLPGSKLLAAATPTQAGIQAAYFARAGMTGYPGILEDRRGFWRRFAFKPLPSMLDGLGRDWVMTTLALKTYPGCHYFQTAFTAIERIRARVGAFGIGDVRAIRIDTTQLACEATRFASEYVAQGGLSPVAVNFDMALSAAVLVHAGRLSPNELRRDWLATNEAAVRALASRTEVRHDPELTAQVVASVVQLESGRAALRALRWRDALGLAQRYRSEYRSRLVSPADAVRLARATAGLLRTRVRGGPFVLPFPNRVTIELTGDRVETEQVDVPVGTFTLPGCEAELARKFVDNVSPSIGAGRTDRAEEVFGRVLDVEAHSIADLVRAITSRSQAN
jgi:2-methylcitrate dehydratase PrpD